MLEDHRAVPLHVCDESNSVHLANQACDTELPFFKWLRPVIHTIQKTVWLPAIPV